MTNISTIENMIKTAGSTAPRITPEHIEEQIIDCNFIVHEGTTFTTCLLTLRNGYQVSGESACASPENFNKEIGETIARGNAVNKIWALEGYLLKDALKRISEIVEKNIDTIDNLQDYTNIYQGHKVAAARLMDRAAYNEYRGWELPTDENGNDMGYLVEYLDGGKPNHVNHKGYISWSPKEQFDNGYTKIV